VQLWRDCEGCDKTGQTIAKTNIIPTMPSVAGSGADGDPVDAIPSNVTSSMRMWNPSARAVQLDL
jgi:hypothetical protein